MSTIEKISFAPPNSLVFLSGLEIFEIPQSMGDLIVVQTPSCLAIGCMSEADGPTEFIFTSANESASGLKLVFSGDLPTPNKHLTLTTVYQVKIIEIPVKEKKVRVSIWVNDLKEPDRILICAV